MEMMMDSIFHTPISLVEIVLVLIIVRIILEDSFFRLNFMIALFLHIISHLWNLWKLLCQKTADNNSPEQIQQVTEKPEEMIKSSVSANLDDEDKQSIEEVNITIEKLILLGETLNPSEIASLFAEEEVSLEEVKDAFRLFDENNDGFIDAEMDA
ncbi:probable calcium-binding protein CML45 [Mangifera indica]|uniref:probable calcium-binding protein CML45 n=1 Tax=Mangifera indica TaxID=29780 RepID=UPI001CFAB1BA|nr:probable calcium-binding protein CML45 [Mangifera indica]